MCIHLSDSILLSAKAACACRYKYMLGANDRKMQKSSSSSINASKLFVAPRDHFLDNAGMSESESDFDAVEEGMLIEAPVTSEKSLPDAAAEGSPGSDERQQAAGQEGSQDAFGKADDAVDGVAGKAGQAGKAPEACRQDEGMEKEKSMGLGSNSMPCTPQVCTATSLGRCICDGIVKKAILIVAL